MSIYHLASAARSDLDLIWLYLARNGGLEVANQTIDSIVGSFQGWRRCQKWVRPGLTLIQEFEAFQ